MPTPSFRISVPRAAEVLCAQLLQTGLLRHGELQTKLLLLRQNSGDPFRWNALLATFSSHGFGLLCMRTFSLMFTLGISIDSYAFCSVLTVASSSKTANLGEQIHASASKSGWLSSIFLGGALIDFYAKSGALHHASQLFDEIPVRNTVCANSLLNGYVECQRWIEGLSLFRRMHELGLQPDNFSLSSLLRICTELPALGLGLQVHAHVLRKIIFLDEDPFIMALLVEMYGNCSLVSKARIIFDFARNAKRKDVVIWTSMLNAYGRSRMPEYVLEMYEEMLFEGMEPDEIVMLAVLSACSNSGNLNKGLHYFQSMKSNLNLVPGPEHYACIVDMLCKAGNLEKAWELANDMMLDTETGNGGYKMGATIWGALLAACKDLSNVELGKLAAKRALELEPDNVGVYVELSNLYARVNRWTEIEELRKLMKEKRLMKDTGCSKLEIMR